MAATIPVFNEKIESWDAYRERLEHYFIALDIDDHIKQKSILINCIGPQYYERLRNLCFPGTPNDKTYDELLDLLTHKYKTENASKWHERMRSLAMKCQFGDRTEQVLLDKFVTSFDGPVFEKFCEEGDNLTLSKALEIAQRYDTIEGIPSTAPKNPQKEGFKKQHQEKASNTKTEKQPKPGDEKSKNTNQAKPFKKFQGKGHVTNVAVKVDLNKK